MSKQPFVSIIMNCFNGEKYIKQAIESIYAQTYLDWEVIFWDNASTDESCNIAGSFDSKIRIFKSKTHTSLGDARNKAVEHASGEWLAFLDVDDVWLPKKLETQLAGLATGDYLLSYGGIKEVDKNLKVIRELTPKWETGFQLRSQLLYFEINLVSSMVNRRKLVELGLSFDPQMQASEEYNLYIRLMPHGLVYVVKETIALYRVYSDSLTYQKSDRLAIERRSTLNELARSLPSVMDMNEFKVATRQADYYDACYMMSKRKFAKARILIRKHASSPIFLLLYLLAFAPYLWKICHNPVTKKKLTSLIGFH